MKKIAFIIIHFLLFANTQYIVGQATHIIYSPEGHTLYCQTPSNGICRITGIYGLTSYVSSNYGILTIPDSVIIGGNLYFVTSISESAFSGCHGLTEVSLPERLKYIYTSAFSDCNHLYSVSFTGDSLISIGTNSFSGCSILPKIDLPNSLTYIGAGAFNNCSLLDSVIIPPNISQINASTFFGCYGLHQITIPSNITQIGESAFQLCSSLHKAIIGKNVSSISIRAFWNCSNLDTVTFLRPTPPTVGTMVFPSGIVYEIPCGATNYYIASYGANHIFHESFLFDIDFGQTNTMGYVLMTQVPNCTNNTAIIQANPNPGYQFYQWNDGNTNNPRTCFINCDTSFVAQFIETQYTLTLLSNNINMGSVSGGGTFNYNESVQISATATPHYHFVRWSDGNQDNPRQYVITGNDTLTAYFDVDLHHVTVTSNNATYGMVSGSGNYPYGSPCTVSAVPYSGYHFVQWSNGVSYNPYSFPVQSDIVLTALFDIEETQYTITAISENIAKGTVVGGGVYNRNEEITIAAIPNTGYQFDHWQDNSTINPRSIIVTSDSTFIAYFTSTQRIEDVGENSFVTCVHNGNIVLQNTDRETVKVFDISGRIITTTEDYNVNIPVPMGVYLVTVGNSSLKKVLVIK